MSPQKIIVFIERCIDWGNNGEITEEPLGLNGNGKIDKGKVVVGAFRGKEVKAKEKKGKGDVSVSNA